MSESSTVSGNPVTMHRVGDQELGYWEIIWESPIGRVMAESYILEDALDDMRKNMESLKF